ncbi:Uncharacterised protein [Acholeplasma oculi]|uniref:Uncharacterized protein n=1 Tax=Acholeplasma oculi TaxID=35623 RepID=A0A061AI63_9MOLU|nr:hypothetical protein [Acholeplasma oculi]CDR31276.1 hypothetical protein Aocu_12030 [Acholeplasma oculi]SKC38565.1 hypothetical protein SAMN02745122_0635 [Acholeplasma oculi]SUT91446.1 Uncharacterised protein [Acholeplasma oculi]
MKTKGFINQMGMFFDNHKYHLFMILFSILALLSFLLLPVLSQSPGGPGKHEYTGWEMIFGFVMPGAGSWEPNPGDELLRTGMGFSWMLSLIPILICLSIIINILNIFDFHIKYDAHLILVTLIMILVLTLTSIYWINYQPNIPEGTTLNPISINELNLYIGGYLSVMCSFVAVTIASYQVYKTRLKK